MTNTNNERKVRVGIDVGGTNTKAVALDNSTYEIIGVGIVPTTHEDELGVSAGVIESFRKCLDENGIDPKEVVFIAHSTTQATNALLEGDVAKVGIVGTASGGFSGWLSRIQGDIKDIELDESGKRKITTSYRFISKKDFNRDTVIEAVRSLKDEGCSVIAASKTFGVDDMTEENLIREVALEEDLQATCASEISKLYGLTRRTRTAVINSSILPTMINTADSTQDAVETAGIEAPLMIMRGDGGVMDIDATIVCERDSHRGIIIGKQGSMLKKIGTNARFEIEKMLECQANLRLWVKVRKDWRDNDVLMKNYGYDKKRIDE